MTPQSTSGKKVLVSGIKSTGTLHIGNYFGAMQQLLTFQDSYDCRIFVADLHALTSLQDKVRMTELIEDTVAGYLAIGLDPKKVTLYKQSDVPEVTELLWVFNCITTMPYLMRAHAYKDAEAKSKDINSGVFNYPLLMAADILIQQASIVPVGSDQKQHVEIARDTAEKFNRTWSDVFTLPEAHIEDANKTILGIDGQKMSKSYGNIIPLFGDSETLKKVVMSITTDSKGIDDTKDPETELVFQYHKLFSRDELVELTHRYQKGGIGYKESKEILLENIENFLIPLRDKYQKIRGNKAYIHQVLEEGGRKACEAAQKTITEVRQAIGVTLN